MVSLADCPLRPCPRRGAIRKITTVALFNDHISSILCYFVHLQDTDLYLTPFTKSWRIILLHPSVTFQSSFSDCKTSCTPRITSQSPSSPLAHPLLSHFLIHFPLDWRAFHSLSYLSLVRTLSVWDILRICTTAGFLEQLCNNSPDFISPSALVYLWINSLHSPFPPVIRNHSAARLYLPSIVRLFTRDCLAYCSDWVLLPAPPPSSPISYSSVEKMYYYLDL